MVYEKDDLRELLERLAGRLAEDGTEAGTSTRSEQVAISRILLGMDAMLRGELSSAHLWLVDAERWIVEAIKRRTRESE
jgi:hypothetical protein